MAMADEFLTVAEIAELLKVNPQTVRNWIDRGELPAVRVGARRVRVRRSDLGQRRTNSELEGGRCPLRVRDMLAAGVKGRSRAGAAAGAWKATRSLSQAASACPGASSVRFLALRTSRTRASRRNGLRRDARLQML
jgi:excisionase family DNA binding protein